MEASSDFPQFSASLSIYSDLLTVADISRPLGEPNTAAEKGQPFPGRRSPMPHTFWSLDSGPGHLEDQVAELVAFIEQHQAAIDQLKEHRSMRIFCSANTGYERNCGFRIDENLLVRLAATGIVLDVGVY